VGIRKELGVESGDTLLAFVSPNYDQGLLLVKVDTLEEILGMMSKELGCFERKIKEKKLTESMDVGEEELVR